ncbi:hypothetical protein PISMIDRAFT_94090, partial [Pisolithus microcarpus 441]
MNQTTRYLCVCKKYNFGRPHSVSLPTWYEHIQQAESDEEKQRIRQVTFITSNSRHLTEALAMLQSALSVVGYGSPGDLSILHSPPLSPHRDPTPPPSPHRDPTPPPSPCRDPTPPPSPCRDPTPPHDPGSPLRDLSDHPDIPLDHGDHANIFYQRRSRPIVDIEALSQSAILPHMRESMQLIQALASASLEDPVSKLDDDALSRLRSPPNYAVSIESPGVRYSISTYLALENASQKAYNRVCHAAQQNFPGAAGIDDILSFYNVERTIAMHTGVHSIEHDMCRNTCLAFTGPFSALDSCPTCGTSRWIEEVLQGTHSHSKVAAQKFTTIPIGPQIQALYRHKNTAADMDYLRKRTNEVLMQIHSTGQVPVLDDIVMGWDYIGAVLDGDIKPDDVVLMVSLDGAQLFDSKESDCWIYIWIVVNLPPTKRYRKLHVCPGGFIPGPNKPKNVDSFLFPGLHHLAALQNEGLSIWNA